MLWDENKNCHKNFSPPLRVFTAVLKPLEAVDLTSPSSFGPSNSSPYEEEEEEEDRPPKKES